MAQLLTKYRNKQTVNCNIHVSSS